MYHVYMVWDRLGICDFEPPWLLMLKLMEYKMTYRFFYNIDETASISDWFMNQNFPGYAVTVVCQFGTLRAVVTM